MFFGAKCLAQTSVAPAVLNPVNQPSSNRIALVIPVFASKTKFMPSLVGNPLDEFSGNPLNTLMTNESSPLTCPYLIYVFPTGLSKCK